MSIELLSVDERDYSPLPFKTSFVDIIRQNIVDLVLGFMDRDNPEIIFTNELDYNQVNAMEQNLEILKTLMDGLEGNARYCGELICGEEYNLL